jgi:hypothetical protein
MKIRTMLVLCAALALTVGAGTATAEGGNSDAAKACQQDGWQTLMRQDGTGFKNDGGCVSYAAQGGKLLSCAGSEDFSEVPEFSTPTTFSGGTIEDPYGPAGGVVVQGSFLAGGFAPGAHVLFSGLNSDSFQLSFTNPTGSVQLDASDGDRLKPTTVTLTAYDASSAVVGTDQFSDPDNTVQTLSVTSSTNNIEYFTVTTDDAVNFEFPNGVEFTNIVWACA